jgi:peptidoglycan-N-acetylglucosamine deacetylase
MDVIRMNGYRITRRGKKFIYTVSFLVIFLIVSLGFRLHANADNIIKQIPFIEKADSQKIPLSDKQNTLVRDNEATLITNKAASSTELRDSLSENKVPTNESFGTSLDKEELSYTVETAYVKDGKKIAFLTFDDGPSKGNTLKILDILNYYKIKATFFIIGSAAEKNPDILKIVRNYGHAIGNHTYSHDYKSIYANVPAFINEIKKTNNLFKDILGKDFNTRLVRFPGGAFNTPEMKPYIKELNNEGYVNIDWNAINGDGEGSNIKSDKLVGKLKDTVLNQSHLVILMHDSSTKQTTVEALPQIIEYLKAEGYEFATLR